MKHAEESLVLENFIQSVLYGELRTQFKYDFFPWSLWTSNMTNPPDDFIFEPKLHPFHPKAYARSLNKLEISTSPNGLKVVEKAKPGTTSNHHILVYQSTKHPNRYLKATFQYEPKKTDIASAQQLLCLIMGKAANSYYQAKLSK